MNDDHSILAEAEKSISDFLRLDARNVRPDEFTRFQKKALVALQAKRDEEVKTRVMRDQALRAIAMIATDPVVREQYIRAASPHMIPKLESRPKE